MPDLAIDRAIAALREQIDGQTWWEIPPDIARLSSLRATLAILEAAKVWDEVMSLANPSTDPVLAELESALMRAIRGKSC